MCARATEEGCGKQSGGRGMSERSNRHGGGSPDGPSPALSYHDRPGPEAPSAAGVGSSGEASCQQQDVTPPR